jgi:hypothetical protein
VDEAFVHRHAAADGEDHDRDDQRPEIQLLAVAERVCGIRRPAALPHTEEQQTLIAGIDQRMDALRQHRRAPADRRGNELAGGDCEVAGEGREHRLLRALCHCLLELGRADSCGPQSGCELTREHTAKA